MATIHGLDWQRSKWGNFASKVLKYGEKMAAKYADEVIVLISSFDVDSSGGDGSLNPNSTYTRWSWILVRNKNGKWKHVDHGY